MWLQRARTKGVAQRGDPPSKVRSEKLKAQGGGKPREKARIEKITRREDVWEEKIKLVKLEFDEAMDLFCEQENLTEHTLREKSKAPKIEKKKSRVCSGVALLREKRLQVCGEEFVSHRE